MTTITQRLKNAAGANGMITSDKALAIAKEYDQERDNTRSLLKELESQVGMHHGEKINTHLANMNGTYFNERDYNYEIPVGDQ